MATLTVGALAYPTAKALPPIKGSTTIDTGTYANGTPVSSTAKLVRSITFYNYTAANILLGTGVANGNPAIIPPSPDTVLPGEYPFSQVEGFINLADLYVNGANGAAVSWLALE